RELALPYCLVAVVLAWREQRRREAFAWLAGFALWGVLLGYHAMQVNQHISAADRLPSSWIQFGGLPFILKTCRMNVFLIRLPAWVSALYLPMALLGLIGWSSATAVRALFTALLYLLAFAVVGQPFNDYWGL